MQDLQACLDAFNWDRMEDDTKRAVYFGMLGTVVNSWRSMGVKKKLIDRAAAQFGNLLAMQLLGQAPGRLLAGRWGSEDQASGKVKKRRYDLGMGLQ